jgi:hypothetical protein
MPSSGKWHKGLTENEAKERVMPGRAKGGIELLLRNSKIFLEAVYLLIHRRKNETKNTRHPHHSVLIVRL